MPNKTSKVKYREWTWTVGSGPNLHWLGSETCPLSSGLCSHTSFKLFIFSQSINYYGLFSLYWGYFTGKRHSILLKKYRNCFWEEKKKVWFVLSSRDCINRHVHDSETLFEKKHSKIQTQGFDVEDLDNRIMIQIKKLFGFSLSVKC